MNGPNGLGIRWFVIILGAKICIRNILAGIWLYKNSNADKIMKLLAKGWDEISSKFKVLHY